MEIDEARARTIEVMMSDLVGLDDLQRAAYLGAEAVSLGEGGVEAVARAAGVGTAFVRMGVAELEKRGKEDNNA